MKLSSLLTVAELRTFYEEYAQLNMQAIDMKHNASESDSLVTSLSVVLAGLSDRKTKPRLTELLLQDKGFVDSFGENPMYWEAKLVGALDSFDGGLSVDLERLTVNRQVILAASFTAVAISTWVVFKTIYHLMKNTQTTLEKRRAKIASMRAYLTQDKLTPALVIKRLPNFQNFIEGMTFSINCLDTFVKVMDRVPQLQEREARDMFERAGCKFSGDTLAMPDPTDDKTKPVVDRGWDSISNVNTAIALLNKAIEKHAGNLIALTALQKSKKQTDDSATKKELKRIGKLSNAVMSEVSKTLNHSSMAMIILCANLASK